MGQILSIEETTNQPTNTPSPLRLREKQRSQVALLRFSLPLVLFGVVSFYETYEHVFSGGEPNIHFTAEILFFGILGPLAVFIVLSYLQRLLEDQWLTEFKLERMNRNLQIKVTERTAELEASNAELRQLDEMKSEFVSLVSHELRAPLTTLQGGLELALQKPDQLSPDSRRILEVMRGESLRLTTFVQRILDLSRLDAGRLPVILGPVALRPLLTRSVAVTLNDERPIEWKLPAELPLVIGDETHLEEAIRNLLSNAHKYSPAGRAIHIQIAKVECCLDVSISDHGMGIPPSDQKRIFNRFFRGGGKDEARETSGWGLGLYLARRLTEAQGGTLRVESPAWPGEDEPGTTFTLSIPLDIVGKVEHVNYPID